MPILTNHSIPDAIHRIVSIPAYNRSARTTFVTWAMLAVGLAFLWAGTTIDPQSNCSESGECAPWLVPIAQGIGALLAASALGQLWVNPNRGSMIEPQTGDLVWWQRRTSTHPGDQGRIAPARIATVRIKRQSEGNDEVHFYDHDDVRQAYFDSEVIPWPYDQWARRLAKHWPHICVEDEPSS